MNKLDAKGFELCDLQGNLFVESLRYDVSSYVFIKRFMYSETAKLLDDNNYFSLSSDNYPFEFDFNKKGSQKISADVIYWVGYIYRYWAYTYGISSKRIYKIISGKELSMLYEPYHTLDPSTAITRIYEAKNTKKINPLELMKKIYKN